MQLTAELIQRGVALLATGSVVRPLHTTVPGLQLCFDDHRPEWRLEFAGERAGLSSSLGHWPEVEIAKAAAQARARWREVVLGQRAMAIPLADLLGCYWDQKLRNMASGQSTWRSLSLLLQDLLDRPAALITNH